MGLMVTSLMLSFSFLIKDVRDHLRTVFSVALTRHGRTSHSLPYLVIFGNCCRSRLLARILGTSSEVR